MNPPLTAQSPLWKKFLVFLVPMLIAVFGTGDLVAKGT